MLERTWMKPQGNACQNDAMRFSLQVLADRLPAIHVELHVKSREKDFEKTSELLQQSAQALLH